MDSLEFTPILLGAQANLALFLVGIGLSIAVNLLFRKKLPGPVKDTNQTTQVDRGSYVPLVIGRARVAPLIGFISMPIKFGSFPPSGRNPLDSPEGTGQGPNVASGRYDFGIGDGGGKRQDAGNQTQDEFYYLCWHILTVGPLQHLHNVWYNGTPASRCWGYTPANHRSGSYHRQSLFFAPDSGYAVSAFLSFGTQDQDLQTTMKWDMDWVGGLGDAQLAAGTGAPLSRWPMFASVYLYSIPVGTIKQLPLIEYELSVTPMSELRGSPPVISERWEHTQGALFTSCSQSGSTDGRVGIDQAGTLFGNRVQVPVTGRPAGEWDGEWKTGDVAYFTGPLAQQWYGRNGIYVIIFEVQHDLISLGYPADNVNTKILNRQSFSNAANRLYRLTPFEEDGCNLAHALDQLLFAPYPHGSGLDRSLFDVESLEEVARIVGEDGERLAGSVLATDGQTADDVIGKILVDIGVMMSWDPLSRKYRFVPIRDGQTRALIPSELLVDEYPEINVQHEQKPTNRITFRYRQRTRNYRVSSFTFDDDGHVLEREAVRGSRIDIDTVANFTSAQKIAIRRSLESVPRHSIARLKLAGAARLLIPGQPIALDDTSIIPYPLRVEAIQYDPRTSEVTVSVVQDLFANANQSSNLTNNGGAAAYDSAVSTALAALDTGEDVLRRQFVDEGGFTSKGNPNIQPAAPYVPDTATSGVAQVDFYEMPRFFSSEKRVRLLVGWIRKDDNRGPASIWLSADGDSYSKAAERIEPTSGGVLTVAVPAETSWIITDQSIVFSPIGPDVTHFGQFVTDDASWNLGRLMMKINDEIFYIKGVTAHPDGTGKFYVDSAVRARLATDRALHPVGSKVTFYVDRMARGVTDVILQPGRDVFVKVMPEQTDGDDLSNIEAQSYTVRGSIFAPLPVASLRLKNGASAVEESSNAEIRWESRSPDSPKSGAGMQGAGAPVQEGAVDEEFVLEIWDDNPETAGVVVRRVSNLTTPSYLYTPAMRSADGIGLADFWVSVFSVRSGLTSTRRVLGPIDQVAIPL